MTNQLKPVFQTLKQKQEKEEEGGGREEMHELQCNAKD